MNSSRREAAAWFTRLNQRRVSSDDVHGFSEWRRIPENAAAYAEVERLWENAAPLGADPEIDALTRKALAGARTRRAARTLRPGRWAVAGVALITAATIAVWAWQRPTAYQTDIGEQRRLTLADGSRVTLDTASRVAVRFTAEGRQVELLDGQALFDVATDPQRPFIVRAGDAEVRALGTRFDVRLLDNGARVVLIEGRVSVSAAGGQNDPWVLNPGQQMVTGPAPAVQPVDLVAATHWTTGRVTFDQTPLRAAVAEMNRYTRTKIELHADGIAGVAVSGVFDTGDTEAFVAAISDLYPVSVRRQDDRIVISEQS